MALWRNALENIAAKLVSYSVTSADLGKLFTTRGATVAVTFTLPPTTDLPSGWWFRFFNVSAYGFVIASSGSADNIVAGNDAGGDSVTVSTTSLMIGASGRITWDGTSWLFERGGFGTYTVA